MQSHGNLNLNGLLQCCPDALATALQFQQGKRRLDEASTGSRRRVQQAMLIEATHQFGVLQAQTRDELLSF